MAVSTIKDIINPPNVANKTTKATLTSGDFKEIVSDGEYLAVRAITTSTSSASTSAYLMADQTADYIACIESTKNAQYVRAMTPWVYIPQGQTVYARALFGSNGSGVVLSAKPL